MPTQFSPAAIRFLKSLKRNNDRNWFNDRKSVFEEEVKAPWLALIDEVNHAMADFAPECVKPAPKAMFRIYRDTRFSSDKKPYKTHVGAWWSPAALAKTSGAGFYAHVGADDVTVAVGAFMPQPEQMLAMRRHLQQNHEAMRALMNDKKLRKLLPDQETMPLIRVPKGFVADDPAAEFLRDRKWGLSATLPLEVATSPKLLDEIVKRFRAAAPLVALLNAPLLQAKTPRRTFF
ncbi:DUF2461 domain-containing protein [Terriglobus sp. RCC_193]|uniref:DUF2461 domain-containing protein n=1 Tax=Terriglobus sp. RCC_193 TaxID=3239218 RepID=UPI003525651C